MKDDLKIGQEVYVDSHFYISHGSDDVVGGEAKITSICEQISGGVSCRFITVEEHPGHRYNWDQFLKKEQDKLKAKFGDKRAYPNPDIDTPWLEYGDLFSENGEELHPYKRSPIW